MCLNVVLGIVSKFTYLGSFVTNNLSLKAELSTYIGKASGIMNVLSKPLHVEQQQTGC